MIRSRYQYHLQFPGEFLWVGFLRHILLTILTRWRLQRPTLIMIAYVYPGLVFFLQLFFRFPPAVVLSLLFLFPSGFSWVRCWRFCVRFISSQGSEWLLVLRCTWTLRVLSIYRLSMKSYTFLFDMIDFAVERVGFGFGAFWVVVDESEIGFGIEIVLLYFFPVKSGLI